MRAPSWLLHFRVVNFATRKEHLNEEMSHAPPLGNTFARRLLAAWTTAVLAFLYLPIVLLIVYSFNNSLVYGVWKGFTLHWYAEIWRDDTLLTALQNSLIIAAITTAISVVLGTIAAWLLHRYRFPAARAVTTLAVLPMVVPEIIMGVSFMLLFRGVGLELGYMTVIISHVTFCFPFVMAAVQARLAGLDPSLEEAALDLGATPARAFMKVIVPYLMPGIVAGAMLSFTLSLDEFIVTFFTCSAQSQTVPVMIYNEIKLGLSPKLNAISTLIVAATVVLTLAGDGIGRRSRT
ncbi:MAG: transporter permease [Phycisphaerales bacterium]|nr:transporter permease [Phycisphaerales bacterium]MDB5354998.1 transporter permease [Phycisphaerales bacterium]